MYEARIVVKAFVAPLVNQPVTVLAELAFAQAIRVVADTVQLVYLLCTAIIALLASFGDVVDIVAVLAPIAVV